MEPQLELCQSDGYDSSQILQLWLQNPDFYSLKVAYRIFFKLSNALKQALYIGNFALLTHFLTHQCYPFHFHPTRFTYTLQDQSPVFLGLYSCFHLEYYPKIFQVTHVILPLRSGPQDPQSKRICPLRSDHSPPVVPPRANPI